MFHAPEDHLSCWRAGFLIPGARGLDSCFLGPPRLDSGFPGPHGMDSDFLGLPELELDLLGTSCLEFLLLGLDSDFHGWILAFLGLDSHFWGLLRWSGAQGHPPGVGSRFLGAP